MRIIILFMLLVGCATTKTVYVPVKPIFPIIDECPNLPDITQEKFIEDIITWIEMYKTCQLQVKLINDFINNNEKFN